MRSERGTRPLRLIGLLTAVTSKNTRDADAIWKMTANAPSNVARLPRNGVVASISR